MATPETASFPTWRRRASRTGAALWLFACSQAREPDLGETAAGADPGLDGADAALDARTPGPADAAPATADAGEPAPREFDALMAVAPEAIDDSDCRIRLDLLDDGSDDQVWAYRYRPDGSLRTRIVWTRDGELDVSDHDAQGRPVTRCHASACARYQYAAYGTAWSVELLARTPDTPSTVEVTAHPNGRIASVEWPAGTSAGPSRVRFDDQGRLTDAIDDEDHDHYAYHPNGVIASYALAGDPDTEGAAWDTDGAELSYELAEDGVHVDRRWSTTYERDAQGRIERSTTRTEQPGIATFTTRWHWDESDNQVTLESAGEAPAWTTRDTFNLREPPRLRHEQDLDGNLVRIVEDGDGYGRQQVHRYRYEGAGACREGLSASFVPPVPPDPARDTVYAFGGFHSPHDARGRTGTPFAEALPSPVTNAVHRALWRLPWPDP